MDCMGGRFKVVVDIDCFIDIIRTLKGDATEGMACVILVYFVVWGVSKDCRV